MPEGLHRTTEKELFERFATGSARRQWLGERLRDLLDLAKSTGELSRLFLWGSFVTSKEIPQDLDVLLVMSTDVDIDALSARCHVLFDHVEARLRFHADLFWSKESIGESMLHLLLDTYQTGKDFKRRGIVEVTLS